MRNQSRGLRKCALGTKFRAMNTTQRHQRIVHRVDDQGTVSVGALAQELEVSEATIRRDLVDMDRAGLLRRTHGGATRLALRTREPAFDTRFAENNAAKIRIAAAAAKLLTAGESVVLDSGTTCLETASQLIALELRVVPLSLPALTVLSKSPTLRLTSPGGDLRPGELAFIGPIAEGNLDRLRFDTAFVSCCGLSLKDGVTAYDVNDAAVKSIALKNSKRSVLLCDDSKWETTTFAVVAPLCDFDILITDHVMTAQEQQFLDSAEVEVITV